MKETEQVVSREVSALTIRAEEAEAEVRRLRLALERIRRICELGQLNEDVKQQCARLVCKSLEGV